MAYLYFFLLSIVSVFSYDLGMTDTHILPKWLYTVGVLALILGGCGVCLLIHRKKRNINEWGLFVIIVLLCLSQALYAITQSLDLFTSRFLYRVVGSFDNPAGLAACLCVGIPCCIYLYRNSKPFIRWFSVVAAILIGIALVLSGSRAGIISGMLLPSVYLLFHSRRKVWIKVLFTAVTAVMLVGLYFMKKDSADGRMLMLRCGWEMIKERPLLGHGSNAVVAHYMDYQAAWLEQHLNSSLAPLADNVKHVFNEYLSIGICYGILGLIVLFLLICFLVYCYKKAPSEEGTCALLSLSAIGMLACFSYPFTYPFTWIISVMSVWILVSKAYPLIIGYNKFRYLFASILLMVSIGLFFKVYNRIKAELQWGEVARIIPIENDSETFGRYEQLMTTLADEPYFLYNYAAELYLKGEYETALLIAQRCRLFWADYDLELLLGELQMQIGRYDEAKKHYRKAANMCPSRFIPLYRLFKMYQHIGDKENMENVRRIILDKPIKVDSDTIRRIIEDLNQYVES